MIQNRSSFKTLMHPQPQPKNIHPPDHHHKPEHSHSVNKLTNPNICIISDEYSKNKLTQLLQEISKLRKEMSQKESFYHRQKGNLLNRLEILNSQNIELKQRQNNLMKINQTLELAISSTQPSSKNIMNRREIQEIREEINEKNKLLKQSKKSQEEYKKIIRNFQAQKYNIIQQKQKIIYELNNKYKTLKGQKDRLLDTIKKDILGLPFKKDMINMIIRSLNCFTQSSEISYEEDFVEESQYMESPIAKRRNPDAKGANPKLSKYFDQSYSRFSSNSIINELNKRQIASEYSQEYQQSERLLCQVCKKVFQQQEFIMHMDQCNQINQLHKKRSQLQKAIDDLTTQQRKSVSHKKKIIDRHQAPQQWDLNTDRGGTQRGKMLKMNPKGRRQYEQVKKIGNRSQIFNNYTSNRLY